MAAADPGATARIAVIGCGSWATEAHLPALAKRPDASVVAVVDPDPEARDLAASRFGVPARFASHEELLASVEVDGVVVATPHALHFEPVRAALEAGAHVLVEKPMVLVPDQARELVRLAQAVRRELLVGYTFHYNRQARTLRDVVRSGRLGTLELASCLFASMVREYYRGDTLAYQPEFNLARAPRGETYSDPALGGGGQGQAQVTHSAALLFWLTGLRPARVAAFTEDFGLGLDLVDVASVVFESGALATISSTGDRPSGHDDLLRLEISGTDALISFDVMQGQGVVYSPGGRREALDPLPHEERYPHWGPADNLVDVVLGLGENESPGEIGSVTVEFLEAMYRSAAAGGAPVDLGPG